MLRVVLAACAMVLAWHGAAGAQIMEVEGRYWLTDVEGSVRVNNSLLSATTVDLKEDLNLEVRNEGAPELRLTFFLPFANKIRFAYARIDMESDATLDETIQFAGSTFTVGTRVESDLDGHYGRLGWAWQFLGIPGLFKVGPLIEVKGLYIDASISSTTPPRRESEAFPLLLPTIGVALDFTPLRALHLFAEASGIPAGDLGHFIDAEVGVRFFLFGPLMVTASYRFFDLKVEDDEDFVKFRLSGPSFGAGLRF
jgi:hypothetical protein